MEIDKCTAVGMLLGKKSSPFLSKSNGILWMRTLPKFGIMYFLESMVSSRKLERLKSYRYAGM